MSGRSRVFTDEQLKKADELGIGRAALYHRVNVLGMTSQDACSRQHSGRGRKKKCKWDKEIYALYRGDELVTDGTIFEIAEKANMSVETVKWYKYHSKEKKGRTIALVYLGSDDEEWDEGGME